MVNKLQTQNISNNMEYVGFAGAMKEITEMNLKAIEIVTDSHTQITSKISEYFFLCNMSCRLAMNNLAFDVIGKDFLYLRWISWANALPWYLACSQKPDQEINTSNYGTL